MKPKLLQGEFVFCTAKERDFPALRPLLVFREDEGTTVVVSKEDAQKAVLSYSESWAMITLTVHSDLQTVGFLAKVTTELAKENISVNVVSAYFHDHLFVPYDKADKAMQVLLALSQNAS
jgi:hypothetical protein